MESLRMGFLDHLEEFRVRLLKVFYTFLPFFVFFMTFSLRPIQVGGVPLAYPWPDFYNAVSIQIVREFLDYYLPDFVEPVQLTPAEAILVQFKVAIFLALLTTMPMIVYQLSRFVAPGLYPREKEIIAKITVPASLLFLAGALVSHFLILPFVFEFLYGIGANIGLRTFASPDQVFDVVLLFFVGLGLAFQTPVAMWGLTALGVVEPDFWKRYWRAAVVAFFVFGAVITPDGSGVTMMLVAAPMTVLYVGGYAMSLRTWRIRQGIQPERRRPAFAVWSAVVLLVAAVAGGYVYFNTSLFAPPTAVAETAVASGTLTLDLPAFVLFSPEPLTGDMTTETVLRATNATAVGFQWRAEAGSGLPVTLVPEGDLPAALEANETGFVVHPTRWTDPDRTSLTLTATEGRSAVYVLHLRLDYELNRTATFADGNGNGQLDQGEVVVQRSLLLRYRAQSVGASFLNASEAGLSPPVAAERTLLDRGAFSSIGSNWKLETSLASLLPANEATRVVAGTEQIPGGDLTLHLDRVRDGRASPGEDLVVRVQGQAPATFEYSWYLDLRYGTLYPVLSAA